MSGRWVIFSALYADFCLCPKSMIITTLKYMGISSYFLYFFRRGISFVTSSLILVVKSYWNAKIEKDAQADWGEVRGPYCNVQTKV